MQKDTGVKQSSLYKWNKGYAFILVCIIYLIIYNLPIGLSNAGKCSVGLTMAAVIMWVFEILPTELTCILLCASFVMFGAVDASVAFSGYANSTVWFVYSALIFGLAVDNSGIGKRLVYNLMRFSKGSLISMLIPVILAGIILSFFTPAGVERIIILYPICVGITSAFTMKKISESNIGKLTIAVNFIVSNCIGFGILTGITPNITGTGIIKSALGIQVYWTQWFNWFFVPTLATVLITILLMFKVFPPEKLKLDGEGDSDSKLEIAQELEKMGSLSLKEKKAILYLTLTLIFWVTGQMNHLAPWIVAIIASCLFCAPKIGFLTKDDLKQVPIRIVLFVGAGITIGLVMGKTGAATMIGKLCLGSLIHAGASPEFSGLITYLVGIIAHFPLLDNSSAVAGYTPIVAEFFKSMGMNALGPSLIAIQVADAIAFVPYMTMPALLLLNWISLKDTMKILTVYSLVAIVINVISMFTWYHWTGLL